MAKVIDTAAIQPGKAKSWPKIFAAIFAWRDLAEFDGIFVVDSA